MIEHNEMMERLRNHHFKLEADDQRMLVKRTAGMRPNEIATQVFKGDRTVRTHLDRVEDIICVGIGLDRRDPVVTGMWVALHFGCKERCLAAGEAI